MIQVRRNVMLRFGIGLVMLCVSNTYLISQTIQWHDSLSNAVVYLAIDEAEYEKHAHRKAANFDVIETPRRFHQTGLKIANKSLRKYLSAVLK